MTLLDKVLEYDRIITSVVPAAKEPGFTRADWAPLEELIAVDDFERIGILRELMNWSQYVEFLTAWAASKEFWTRLRRITEKSPLVFLEVEEHHLNEGRETIINSMSVFEFDQAGKIRHLDVYLQGELYVQGEIPEYAKPKPPPGSS